ncbi:MAG: S24 family peptidase [Porphyromonadaceae bacterium]|nr:S24 family peptidase [Porphyromonadaceae bacterium]
MDKINSRIREILDSFFNGNVSEMARQTQIPQTTLNNIVANKFNKPSADSLEKLTLALREINLEWLLTGKGEMLNKPVVNEVEAVPEDMYMMTEYADLMSSAGRLGGGDIQRLPETHRRLLPREYEKGNYLVVRVSGNSMNDGSSRSLFDGDEILIRELMPSEWENLPIRKRLFVITSREGNILKQIKEVNRDEKYIVCHSFNPTFEDFRVSFDDIYQIFVVYKIVQKQIILE